MKYISEFYRGRRLGNGYMSRVGYQVVAIDEKTGKRRAVFGTYRGKSPCKKSNWVASHYISGPNKHDQEILNGYREWAYKLAEEYNRMQPF